MNEVRTFVLEIHDEGAEGLWAAVQELPGCIASGRDMDELMEALAEAISLYLSEPGREVQVELGANRIKENLQVQEQKVLVRC